MAFAARKRARTAGEDGGSENEAVAVADGFEAPLFGARVVGQVTTLPLEGEDGPVTVLDVNCVVSDHAGAASPLARTEARCLWRTWAATRSCRWRLRLER